MLLIEKIKLATLLYDPDCLELVKQNTQEKKAEKLQLIRREKIQLQLIEKRLSIQEQCN